LDAGIQLRIPVIIAGFGNVSQALVRLLNERFTYLRDKHGIEISVVGAVEGGKDEFFSAFLESGLDLDLLIETKRKSGRISFYPQCGGNSSTLELIKMSGARLLFEATPTRLNGGEPGLSHIRTALDLGMHVVTSNKGPIVFAAHELAKLASIKGVKLFYSAAVAGALPIMPTGEYSLNGCRINAIEGILNGTTNYILTEMAAKKLGFEDALAEAQKLGIAERDPRYDIEGYDTAFKLIIAANALMNADLKISDVEVSGIQKVTYATIDSAKERGSALKLVGRVEKREDKINAKVGVEEFRITHPFYSVNGKWKGVIFSTDLLGEVVVLGGASSPTFTAGAMLRDFLNISQFSDNKS
jgi:homoserine dehydrogenase